MTGIPVLGGLAALLISSFAWSGLDPLRKLLLEKVPPVAVLFVMTLGLVPAFALWVWASDPVAIQPGYYLPALGSIVLNVGANLAYLESVRRSPLSTTIPLLSLTPVFATLFGLVLLREVPGGPKLAGIGLVVAGALALNRRPSAAGGGAFTALLSETGSLLMMLVALLWAAAIGLDKLAIAAASGPVHGLVVMGGIGLATFLMLLARGQVRDLARFRQAPGLTLVSLAVGFVAFGAQVLALQTILVGVVETVKRGIGNVLAVAMGRAIFGEPVTPLKVIAVLMMALGVALVLLR